MIKGVKHIKKILYESASFTTSVIKMKSEGFVMHTGLGWGIVFITLFYFCDFFVSLLAYCQFGNQLLATKCVMLYLSDMLKKGSVT